MSFDESVRSITLEADSSIGVYTGPPGAVGSAVPNGGKQYCFVKVTGALTAGLATDGGDDVIGVLQNKPQQAGGAATVAIRGVVNVVAGDTVTAGAKVSLILPVALWPSGRVMLHEESLLRAVL